jgi:hypothetical protein
MKYFLIIVGSILVLIFLGYKYVNYKFINSQERSFKELSTAEIKESQRYFADSTKLSDLEFWTLIEKSKGVHPNDFDAQLSYLTKQLSTLQNKQIIGFERTLREKVIELWNYDVKSLYQIMYGEYVSPDVFIYFRFWIVSNGQKFFQTALENPDELAEKININDDGEGLLYVADDAFILKNCSSSELESPRDQSFDVDYDFGNYKMTGEYTEPDNFETKFPKLTKKF